MFCLMAAIICRYFCMPHKIRSNEATNFRYLKIKVGTLRQTKTRILKVMDIYVKGTPLTDSKVIGVL